jgi:hypothetical protein
MNLLAIRTKFVDLSGRYDLVNDTTDYVDNGADFFISSGQRFLDNHQLHPKSILRYQKDIAVGTYTIEFKDALAIKEVWFTTDDSRKILEQKPLGWIKEEYGYPFSATNNGDTTYYSINIIGLMGDQDALTSSDYNTIFTREHQDIHFITSSSGTSHQYYRGILIMPPNEKAGTITVIGQFKAKDLSDSTDENFWSVNYPDLLIQAANYSLESFYRNTEGANDWRAIIEETLKGIDYNMVEEDITGVVQLREELEYLNKD